MKINRARTENALELSRIMAHIINNTPYYSKKARIEEVKKHNYSSLKKFLEDRKYYICFLATEDTKVVGFLIGRNEAGVFWADWLGIKENFRRKGLAEKLMKKLHSSLGNSGVHKIWCDTRTNNKESISLLNKLKYKKLGSFRNGWYKQDFFLWEKDL